ncbi:MAG: TetR/AcrR family transcriptional regulator [Sphingobium sp.]
MDSISNDSFIVPDLLISEREGGYAKGDEVREQILRAALSILVENGYRAMSMRRVAKESGLKFGNLTYYYPSREDLVRDLLEAIIRAYEIQFDQIVQEPDVSSEFRLAEYCSLVLEDIRTKKTTRVFPELWALANHDAFVSERVQELYTRARKSLVSIVGEMRPDLGDNERDALALFVSASMEGLTVFAGFEKPFEARMPWMENISIRAFIEVIRNAVPEDFEDKQLWLDISRK